MKMNFFDWIREGVRQSVLLGLSDAASEVASPKEAEDLNQHFLASVQQGRVSEGPKNGRGKRKALGRSLRQTVDAE